MRRVKLGQICEVVSGGTPKTNVEEYWNGEFNWITPAEINDNDYIISDTKRKITQLAIEKKKLPLLPKGTVLLSSRAPIGKVAITGKEMYCKDCDDYIDIDEACICPKYFINEDYRNNQKKNMVKAKMYANV